MPSQDAPAGAAGTNPPRFDSELVYQPPLRTRLGMLGVSVGLTILVLAVSPLLLDLITQAPESFALRCAIGALWLVALGFCLYLALTVRNRFVVGIDRVSVRNWRGTRTLLFSDVADCSATLENLPQPRNAPKVQGARLTIRSGRQGVAPLSMVVDEREPIDAAIVERLKALPMLHPRALRELERMSSPRAGGG